MRKYCEIVNKDLQKGRIVLPLIGTIRLGRLVMSSKCRHPVNEQCDSCRPTDCSYFVTPDPADPRLTQAERTIWGKFRGVYGAEPTEIDILLPTEDKREILPQSLVWYGMTAKKCEGNGEVATRWDENVGGGVERKCPCEQLRSETNPKGQCMFRATFFFILYKVNMGGVFRITTTSASSTTGILSGLELYVRMVNRFSRMPLTLIREKAELTYIERDEKTKKAKQRKSIHYPLKIRTNLDFESIAKLAMDENLIAPHLVGKQVSLPIIPDINPHTDPGAITDAEVIPEPEATTAPAQEKPQEKPVQPPQPPTAKPKPTPAPVKGEPKTSDYQRKYIMALCGKSKIDDDTRHKICLKVYGIQSTSELTVKQASDFIEKLNALQKGTLEISINPDGEPYFSPVKRGGQ